MNVLFVDVETTGVNKQEDQVVEIGLVMVNVDLVSQPLGKVLQDKSRIVRAYGSLHEPLDRQISEEAAAIHGITNEMVQGHRMDLGIMEEMFRDCEYYVAHNALFDAPFIQQHFKRGIPVHEMDKWLCSLTLIDWKAKGHTIRNLTYLAAINGFVNPFPHSALGDAMTLFRLSFPWLQEMIEAARQDWFVVKALAAPYDAKDTLRARGYKPHYADGKFQFWYIVLPGLEGRLEDEKKFLADEVYIGAPMPQGLAHKIGKWYLVPSDL